MNARPAFFLPAPEEADLIVSRWQRQSEELLLQRLYGAPEAGEEIEEDDSSSLPPLVPLDDEYTDAGDDPSPIGLEDDAEALASSGMVEEP